MRLFPALFTCLSLLIPAQLQAVADTGTGKVAGTSGHLLSDERSQAAYQYQRKRVSPVRERPFFRITYSNEAQFSQIEQPDGDLLNVTFGRLGEYRGTPGSFLHFGASLIEDEKGQEYPQQAGRWLLASAGFSFSLIHGLELYAGPGWGWSDTMALPCEDCQFKKEKQAASHDELNWHLGLTYQWHSQVGISVEFDSAPNTVAVGFTFNGH